MLGSFLPLGLFMEKYVQVKMITMNSVKTQVSPFCPGMAKEMGSSLACYCTAISIPKEKWRA